MSFLRYSHFRVQKSDWPYPPLTMSKQNTHAEIESVSLTCSGEILDLKILQSYWLRAFWTISQE